MTPELTVIKKGVAAVIPRDGSFLTIEEMHSSWQTQKISGMRSMIFETVEKGESFEEALFRVLTKEELLLGDLLKAEMVPGTKLCEVQLNRGIWLYAFLLPVEIPADFPLLVGSAKDEVKNPDWDLLDDALYFSIGCSNFRPGNREVLQSYLRFRNHVLTEPDIYFHTSDYFSKHTFDEWMNKGSGGNLKV